MLVTTYKAQYDLGPGYLKDQLLYTFLHGHCKLLEEAFSESHLCPVMGGKEMAFSIVVQQCGIPYPGRLI